MSLFSQRNGLTSVKSVIQVDSMDADLRNSLWNALKICYWNRLQNNSYISEIYNREIFLLVWEMWVHLFKEPLDTLDEKWKITYGQLRDYFFTCQWNEVYDFIEFIANKYINGSVNKEFIEVCNVILEREVSAYRFVGGRITQITSETEVAEIEEALEVQNSLNPVSSHLKRALELLADRKAPDYRNSIKESISAVEAICQLITGNNKATLGQALKEIENKLGLHPALNKGFSNLYGYTSDADGIRHALLEESNLSFEDAKFMLVSCSGFINYLKSKASKAGINL